MTIGKEEDGDDDDDDDAAKTLPSRVVYECYYVRYSFFPFCSSSMCIYIYIYIYIVYVRAFVVRSRPAFRGGSTGTYTVLLSVLPVLLARYLQYIY